MGPACEPARGLRRAGARTVSDVPLAVLEAARLGLAAAVVAWCGWWTLLAAVALKAPRRPSTRAEDAPSEGWRWAVVVPAHDEQQLVGQCVDSLHAAGERLPRTPLVLVVADNCTDGTLEVALAHQARVLERRDAEHRGKGYALAHAMAHLAEAESLDAVAFVDADSVVEPEFFVALQAAFRSGASVAQAYYQVASPDRSPLEGGTSLVGLRRLAFMLVHWARPLGLQRLGLASGLKGNGMAFRWEEARRGLGSEGIAEDAAMTLALADRGAAVAFAPRARVHGYMASSYRDAQVQDHRWERGRLGLAGRALRTAAGAARRGQPACLAAALEVASPPLSALAMAALLVAGSAFLGAGVAPWLLALAPASLVAYVALGLIAARAGWRDLLALRAAPRFVLHKAGVFVSAARPGGTTEWTRTARGPR